MLNILIERLRQGRRTVPFPKGPGVVPDRLRARPCVDAGRCAQGCSACADACPVAAIATPKADKTGAPAGAPATPAIDLGRCLFCGACADACPAKAIRFTNDFRLAVRRREHLETTGAIELAAALDRKMLKLFGRSLALRQVSAGGCNACEADCNVLTTVVFDLSRFGIHFTASPRHADGILVTGPVSKNMELALRKTYDAVPPPKIVIAVGSCAISGGPYAGHPEVCGGAAAVVPVDLFVPGCPPHPLTILDGLLRLLNRL